MVSPAAAMPPPAPKVSGLTSQTPAERAAPRPAPSASPSARPRRPRPGTLPRGAAGAYAAAWSRGPARADRRARAHVGELLRDQDEAIARWRFHDAQMAARGIGSRPGTGGGGVAYLDTTIALRFFPELWEVRSRL